MIKDFTTANADRLLGFADQFIEDWETDEGAEIDSDERERIEEYRRIRPLLAAAPRMLVALQSAEAMIRLELQPESDTGLHQLLLDIRSAIIEAEPVQPKATVTSKKQELMDRILALLPFSTATAMLLAEAITGEVTEFFYDPDSAITHVWRIEDIQLVRPDLNDTQAIQVLRYIDDHCDSTSGISWDSLEFWADDLFPMVELPASQ